MTNTTLPESHATVMVTYMKTFSSGPYGEKKEVREVTRKGFYSHLFDNWSVPEEWQHFRMGNEICLLPHGWNRDKLTTDQVIKWEPIKE